VVQRAGAELFRKTIRLGPRGACKYIGPTDLVREAHQLCRDVSRYMFLEVHDRTNCLLHVWISPACDSVCKTHIVSDQLAKNPPPVGPQLDWLPAVSSKVSQGHPTHKDRNILKQVLCQSSRTLGPAPGRTMFWQCKSMLWKSLHDMTIRHSSSRQTQTHISSGREEEEEEHSFQKKKMFGFYACDNMTTYSMS
jgi:hypothetical protein